MDQLRAMRVFARVIDEGSFAGAARALDLAPAVVTRLIAELEEHLGARLIQRTTRSLALSSVGERYLERVRHILADVDESASQIQSLSESPQGNLRVMVPAAFAVHQLAKHLPAFHAEYPQVTLALTSAIEFSDPDDRHDLTVMALRDAPEGDFIARRLARSEVILCASPAYLDRAGRPDSPQCLEQHQMLLPPTAVMQRDVTFVHEDGRAAVRVNPPRRPLLTTAHTDTLYASALAGLGITGLMSLMVEDALQEGALERVLPGWHAMSFGLWLTMPTRKHVPARTRAFWEFLLRTFGGEDRDPWQVHPRCSGARSTG
jgi:DNA-binding transcriptional LysR family regulator